MIYVFFFLKFVGSFLQVLCQTAGLAYVLYSLYLLGLEGLRFRAQG